MVIKVSLEIVVLGHTKGDDIERLREAILDTVVSQADVNPESFLLEEVEAT